VSRQEIRQMKRVLMHGGHPAASVEARILAREAAVSLLERGIRFNHGRLAVLRLAMVVQSGAVIQPECWHYCHQVASSCKHTGTQELFLEAFKAASVPPEIQQLAH
jgi:hypothetical protein